ncbi:MAG: DUF2182 domain-containing protein [Pseudomonadota bacterium]
MRATPAGSGGTPPVHQRGPRPGLKLGRRWHWLVFYGLILLAWAVLIVAHMGAADLRAARDTFGAAVWSALCAPVEGGSSVLALVPMWMLMAAAMMAPTLVPALRTYDDFVAGQLSGRRDFLTFLGGYLAVWAVASFIGATAQLALLRLDLIDPLGQSVSLWLNAGLLMMAGLYQFSPVKDACLTACRRPMVFFMQHWEEGPWRMGLRMGVLCLACCWALMLLAFVGGMLAIGWMALAAALMTLEKMPDLGRWVTWPLGAGLIAAGLTTAVAAPLI